MTTRERFARLEQEIVKEKAAVLGRAGERLEAALAVLAALDRPAPSPRRRPPLSRAAAPAVSRPA